MNLGIAGKTALVTASSGGMGRNIARLRSHLAGFDTILRPHLKTGKSIDVAQRMMATPAGPVL